MPYYKFIWTDENIQHIADNYVDPDEAEDVVCDPIETRPGQGNTIDAYGYTATGRYIMVSYILIDQITVNVVTAFPKNRKRRK